MIELEMFREVIRRYAAIRGWLADHQKAPAPDIHRFVKIHQGP
jgi:hypothetical protein